MIARVTKDAQKAKSLRSMAMVTLERLKETDREKYPSNTLVDYYDILHKLMDAIAALDGVKAKGEGAHQELIDYVSKAKGLDEQTRLFLQQMRDYRNRIAYEGFAISKNYIVTNKERIESLIRDFSRKADEM